VDASLLQILLRRSRQLDMTRKQIRRACWKRGQCKNLQELSDEYAVELAGKMKVLIEKKKRASVTMGQQEQIVKVHKTANGDLVRNPMTGEELDINDIDRLIEASLQASHLLTQLKSFDLLLRKQALDLAERQGPVRRLKG